MHTELRNGKSKDILTVPQKLFNVKPHPSKINQTHLWTLLELWCIIQNSSCTNSMHGREGENFSFRQRVFLCIYSWLDSALFLFWMSLFIQGDYFVKFLCMTALKQWGIFLRQNDLCSLPRQTIQYHSNASLCPNHECQKS